ncbi:MAG: FIG00994725: hypothetical protein, partial [uncultured Nocardioides sp.]
DVPGLPDRCARLLRRPRGRQHQVVLGGPQGGVRRVRRGADEGALRRPGPAVRPGRTGREGVPALPRRALRQGQDTVQDPPGSVRRRGPVHRLLRRAVAARCAGGRRVLRGERPPARGDPRRDGRGADRPRARPPPHQVREGRLGDRRGAAADRPAGVRRHPSPHRPAAAQAALRRPPVRLRRGRDRAGPPGAGARRLGRPAPPGRVGGEERRAL